MTSAFPRLFPAGALARPKPAVVMTSTSMVSSPLLLKIFLAMRSSIIDDTIIVLECAILFIWVLF